MKCQFWCYPVNTATHAALFLSLNHLEFIPICQDCASIECGKEMEVFGITEKVQKKLDFLYPGLI